MADAGASRRFSMEPERPLMRLVRRSIHVMAGVIASATDCGIHRRFSMFDQLGPAMRRALAATRSSNVAEATRILQDALGGSQRQEETKPGREETVQPEAQEASA